VWRVAGAAGGASTCAERGGVCLIPHPLQWGYTPLHLAAAKGHAEQVEMLVKAGANVNTKKQVRGGIGKGRGPRATVRVIQISS
jgi:hypothetical protein